MNKTSIEWTDYTWNPVTGCDKVSAGCRSCYAETIANRFWGNRKFTDVQMHIDRLSEPQKNKKKWAGKKVFVCSMSDLFHEDVTLQFIDHLFATMAICPDVTFQILTKRPARALQWAEKYDGPVFPLPNVWIGVSCENQEQANIRIPLLLQIPAAVRFLSCEPLLGYIDITEYEYDSPFFIDWVIAGGESGGFMARPCNPSWVRFLRDQCIGINVPFLFKQWGEYISHTQAFDGQITKGKRASVIDGHAYFRIGKSKSGNMLDGKQHLSFPSTQHLMPNT